jgi:L-alanine-DL-glutamate epimerase-like enolase superfamily enzyme
VMADYADHGSRVDYIEQPTPRDAPGPGAGASAIPALTDEGLPEPGRLDELTGWDGVVVKTCRGQTSALLTYSWARHRGRFVVQQDLTHVGAALAHAAAFAAHCDYSVPAFECNSLQYAPHGNDELARTAPGLVTVVDGAISVPMPEAGIR